MLAVKAKIYGVLYKQYSSIAFDETSSYWSALKSLNFSAFHWSPHGSLVSIGQNFVTTEGIRDITDQGQNGPRTKRTTARTKRTTAGQNGPRQDKTDHVLRQNGPRLRTKRTMHGTYQTI